MTEKAYKTMRWVGHANITIGVVVMVLGIAAGIISIVGGSRLLKNKNELTFQIQKGRFFERKEKNTISYIRENPICFIYYICILFFTDF